MIPYLEKDIPYEKVGPDMFGLKLTAGDVERQKQIVLQHRFELVKELIKEFDAVVNWAAESHVDRSISNPYVFIESNVLGVYTILEAIRKVNPEVRLVHIGTDEVYGDIERGSFTEEDRLMPSSPYSASKAAGDMLVLGYARTYNLNASITRCTNNYGPYQFPEKLIPLMILNALEGKGLPVYGDGLHVRDWLYVRDHCTAIWAIMNHGTRGETYNVGGASEMENIRIVEMVCDLVDELAASPVDNPRRELIEFVKDRPGHDRRYAIDFSKLKGELGWSPKESLESGMRKTVIWYLKNQEWVDRVRSGEYRSWIREQYGESGS